MLTEEVKRDGPRKSIVNFTAGYAGPMNFGRPNHGQEEAGALAGIDFHRTKWSSTGGNNIRLTGLTYMATDGDTIVDLIGIAFGPKGDEDIQQIEKIFATFHKK
jgi:hypothetical protein